MLFTNVKVMKEKVMSQIKSCDRKMQRGILAWILQKKKDISGKTGETGIKLVVIVLYQAKFLVLISIPRLCKMLTLREAG